MSEWQEQAIFTKPNGGAKMVVCIRRDAQCKRMARVELMMRGGNLSVEVIWHGVS